MRTERERERDRIYREANREKRIEADRAWRRDHPEESRRRVRDYQESHKEIVRKSNANWLKKNPGKKAEQNKLYYQRHLEEIREYKRLHPGAKRKGKYNPERSRAYYEAHKEKAREYGRRYYAERLAPLHSKHYQKGVHLGYRKRHEQAAILRGIVLRMVSGRYRNVSGTEYIGCSAAFLHNHIESLFLPGMSWENRREWHIDHVVPLSWFPLKEDPSLLFVASHWTNLQPLWGTENRKKGDRYMGVAAYTLEDLS